MKNPYPIITLLLYCGVTLSCGGSDVHVNDSNDSSSTAATGILADDHTAVENYYNAYDELRCECFWEDITHSTENGFDSAEHCTDTLVVDEVDIQQEASCFQSLLDDASDIPPNIPDHFQCTTSAYEDARDCVDELSRSSSCSELTIDMAEQCDPEHRDNFESLEQDCYDFLTASDLDWLDHFYTDLSAQCSD